MGQNQKSWLVERGFLYTFTSPFPYKLKLNPLIWVNVSECAKETLDPKVYFHEVFLSGIWLTYQWGHFLLPEGFTRFTQGHLTEWGHLRFPAAFHTNPVSCWFGLVVSFLHLWAWLRPAVPSMILHKAVVTPGEGLCMSSIPTLCLSCEQLPQGQQHPPDQSAQQLVVIS